MRDGSKTRGWVVCGAAVVAMLAGGGLFASGPRGESLLHDVFVPPENPMTEEKRVLGKLLFWDEQLSSDNTISCGTCHIPSAAGGDRVLAIHPGPDGAPGTPAIGRARRSLLVI